MLITIHLSPDLFCAMICLYLEIAVSGIPQALSSSQTLLRNDRLAPDVLYELRVDSNSFHHCKVTLVILRSQGLFSIFMGP